MATKSKLEKAVEERALSLNDAQREIALSQLSTYKKNNARIGTLRDQLNIADSQPTTTLEEVRYKQSQRTTISVEINQLTTANSRIAADLFELMKEQ